MSDASTDTEPGTEPGSKIRVYLLDDHDVVREGLKFLLEQQGDIEVVGQSATATEAAARIPALRPHVAVLDARLPDGSGIEVCRTVRAVDPTINALILTSYDDDEALFAAIMAGAAGYVGKGGDATELLRAVREVARGKRFLASGIAQNLALSGIGGDGSPFDDLSPRELEIALLLVQGLRQDDIARQLSLSAKTVNTHKTRLFEKLGIGDNIALARLASRYGLIDPAQAL